MWTFFLWIVLVCGAGLCYPRRPRTAGGLFIATGILAIVLTLTKNYGNGVIAVPGALWIGRGTPGAFWIALAVPGAFWIGLGTWYLVKYRNPEVRARHVEYWTAKA